MPDQTSANYEWFVQSLPQLLPIHRGQHALLHDREISGFFSDSMEAVRLGMARFGEGNFSVEVVDDSVEDLGFYSHVSSALRA